MIINLFAAGAGYEIRCVDTTESYCLHIPLDLIYKKCFVCKIHMFLLYICFGYCYPINFQLTKIFDLLKVPLNNLTMSEGISSRSKDYKLTLHAIFVRNFYDFSKTSIPPYK